MCFEEVARAGSALGGSMPNSQNSCCVILEGLLAASEPGGP